MGGVCVGRLSPDPQFSHVSPGDTGAAPEGKTQDRDCRPTLVLRRLLLGHVVTGKVKVIGIGFLVVLMKEKVLV